MTTNYKRCRRSLATFCRSRGAAWAPAMIACASALVMCGCGESSATVMVTRQAGAEVLLLPVLRGGAAGWCITVAPGGGCPIFRLKRGPIVAEFWIGEGASNRAEGFALTTGAVAAVAVDGEQTYCDTPRAGAAAAPAGGRGQDSRRVGTRSGDAVAVRPAVAYGAGTPATIHAIGSSRKASRAEE